MDVEILRQRMKDALRTSESLTLEQQKHSLVTCINQYVESLRLKNQVVPQYHVRIAVRYEIEGGTITWFCKDDVSWVDGNVFSSLESALRYAQSALSSGFVCLFTSPFPLLPTALTVNDSTTNPSR